MYQAALPADAINSLDGKQVSEPLHSQQMLLRAQLSARPPLASGQLAMTIPVTPASAVGGQIQRGELAPRPPLPSESYLVGHYGVSRGTARRAVEVLRDEGLVRTIPQRGTYVDER